MSTRQRSRWRPQRRSHCGPDAGLTVRLLPLVPDVPLPRAAGAALRAPVPKGYGVQEQCLPFTAATALGLLVPSPIDFGLCAPAEVPADARAFAPPPPARDPADTRVFYVRDRPGSRFVGNAYRFEDLAFDDARGVRQRYSPVEPGISFFDREDQRGLFKLHLPWILRTDAQVDTLYTSPMHRPSPLELKSGLVETDWYAHPVNLVAAKPALGPVHVRVGEVVAQALFVPRAARRPALEVVDGASGEAAALRNDLLKWYVAHRQDRSAYRRLARSRHGRIEPGASEER